MHVVVEREIAGKTFRIETGKLAKQASGAVTVQYGDTVTLVASVGAPGREGLDFFPLTVDYRERTYAAGKFPGGFIKREGRPTTKEILTMRLIDRPIRPLFPEWYREEVQVMASVLSADLQNDPDILAMNGSSASLCISPDIPFAGPIGAVRIASVDNTLIVMPTQEDLLNAELDMIVAGTEQAVLMIEGFANQLPEKEMLAAILFAHEQIKVLCEMQTELCDKVGHSSAQPENPEESSAVAIIEERHLSALRERRQHSDKQERSNAVSELKEQVIDELVPEGSESDYTAAEVANAFKTVEKKLIRRQILDGVRADGRTPGDLRAISCEVGVLPRTHGSALFTRGQTQSLVAITLGTGKDEQRVDGLIEEYSKRFYLDYNFPSFSVGEVRPNRGPGRREIGHGALAERSVFPVVPDAEAFPYTMRVVSEILESNGSSSMASVCGATLALMDAGVPLSQPVAGISIGLVKEGEEYVLLTDIMGEEDHFGDMDFKVAGTQRGITGIQLDLKIDGISETIIEQTLEQAKNARMEILKPMLKCIRMPREETSAYAPRLLRLQIDPEKIGLLIGPGGKTIRRIQEESGANIDVTDDGTVVVSCPDAEGAEQAFEQVNLLTEDIEVGRTYNGRVTSVKDFGAFVEIQPGKDGLVHISELANGFVKSVGEICKVGDPMQVKVLSIDNDNRVKLSRKALMPEEPETSESDSSEES
ncbi:MAG: polyribonucleotide nucleotidyltransferase [Planctomycetes bacterium]|nr:polyribonucleotide nucleotidyltransferase [Planctomycetota bacterium]